MAFDLPRSPRSLRFTGSVRALSKEEAAPAHGLGQARPKKGPPPPAARLTTPTRLTTLRGPLPSVGDEDVDTLCLDRDALDIAVLPDARLAKNLPPTAKDGPHLPVPGFRSKDEVAKHRQDPTVVVRAHKGGSLPLGVWLFAAMIAGIVSFHFAPQAREGLQEAMRALDSR
ncbi:MAG TPA: hypothetical protein VLT33_06745 [Labilithrix sp.]|nr:hypothetical protein [Labilithrix sp.]